MAISKNNPSARDNMRLYVYCPTCDKVMKMLMSAPSRQMFYVCSDEKCNCRVPITKGSYKDLRHEWANKK